MHGINVMHVCMVHLHGTCCATYVSDRSCRMCIGQSEDSIISHPVYAGSEQCSCKRCNCSALGALDKLHTVTPQTVCIPPSDKKVTFLGGVESFGKPVASSAKVGIGRSMLPPTPDASSSEAKNDPVQKSASNGPCADVCSFCTRSAKALHWEFTSPQNRNFFIAFAGIFVATVVCLAVDAKPS
jgi:hypothetical protein